MPVKDGMKNFKNSAVDLNLLGVLRTGPKPPAWLVTHHKSSSPTASMKGAEALTPVLERDAAHLSEVQPAGVAAALGGLVGDVDKQALTGEYAEYVTNSFRRGVSAGIAGWRDDDLAFVTPWGFEVTSIITPVAVWQGGEDRMVPKAHGAWLASHIPGAEPHLLPDEGHLSLAINRFGHILDSLLAMAETAPNPTHA